MPDDFFWLTYLSIKLGGFFCRRKSQRAILSDISGMNVVAILENLSHRQIIINCMSEPHLIDSLLLM
ncbi:hypothetical protein C4A71_03370 [Escherichia coli]|nr:hypothetical protein C4A71_03370 [Escherichia coli]RDO74105.1 hypothetical protein C4A69_03343 [Escherichia coli]